LSSGSFFVLLQGAHAQGAVSRKLFKRTSFEQLPEAHTNAFSDEECKRPPRPEVLDNATALKTTHIAYVADPSQFDALLTSLVSIARHIVSGVHVHVHVLVPKGSGSVAEAMVHCFYLQVGHLRHHVDVEVMLADPTTNPAALASRVVEKSTLLFAKFSLPDYFPWLDRILWLDVDTVVKADISTLYRMRLSPGIGLAAVRDRHRQIDARFKEALGGAPVGSPIFHTGVLLCDLAEWRHQGASMLLQQFAMQNPWLDEQAVFNAVFQSFMSFLPWWWNLQGLCMDRKWPQCCLDQARILHFAGDEKPWARAPDRTRSGCALHGDRYTPAMPCDYFSFPPFVEPE